MSEREFVARWVRWQSVTLGSEFLNGLHGEVSKTFSLLAIVYETHACIG